MTNSESLKEDEYSHILHRKEYTSKAVTKFLQSVVTANAKTCHNCGKSLGVFKLKAHHCNFCMANVCSKECLSKNLFVIPRDFNLKFDLEPKSVCHLAATFLERKCYLTITTKHPQVKQ